jgi:hypothetical protein
MIALVFGALLAVGVLAYVLYPVFFGVRPQRPPATPARSTNARDNAVAALREIEFDRETGKLSDADYAVLKARYTQQAVDAMRREEHAPVKAVAGTATATTDDEIEAAIAAYRRAHSCTTCGPRPEPDALFCSECGRYLRGSCANCGAPVEITDARFCGSCGNQFAG